MQEYEIVVVRSSEAGKYLAWTMSKAGHRTALIERMLIGGSCPKVACLPSNNVVHSAKIASLAKRAHEFGLGRVSARDEYEGGSPSQAEEGG